MMLATSASTPAKFRPVMDRRAQQLAWVEAVRLHLGVTRSRLARLAGVTPSTINKKFDGSDPGLFTDKTLVAIAEVAQLDVMEMPGLQPPRFADVEAYEAEDDDFDRTIQMMARALKNVEPYVMRSNALLGSRHILPGEVLLLDRRRTPGTGDIAIAEVRGEDGGLVARVHRPPHLLGGPDDDPLYIDGNRIRILGTVVLSIRNHPVFSA